MLSSRIVQSCIDRLQEITHVDLFVVNSTEDVVATTTDETTNARVLADFAASAADSQVILQTHLFKVREEGETVWIVGASGQAESAHMTGRICVEQLLQLMQAYQEKYDRSSFFQNLLLDNLLLVDIYNRARQLHIPDERERVVFLVEEVDTQQTKRDRSSAQIAELLSSMFGRGGEDCVTRIEQKSVIVVKTVAKCPCGLRGEGKVFKGTLPLLQRSGNRHGSRENLLRGAEGECLCLSGHWKVDLSASGVALQDVFKRGFWGS